MTYKLNLYKMGLCTADNRPANDLTLMSDVSVEMRCSALNLISRRVLVQWLPIPEFCILSQEPIHTSCMFF